MMRVRKANVILDVPESAVESYRKRGYCVISEDGEVLHSAHPVTLEEYKALCNAQATEIDSMHKELAKARATIADLKKKIKENSADKSAKDTKE